MAQNGRSNRHEAVKKPGPWILVLIGVLVVVAVIAVLNVETGPPARSGLSPRFDYDLSEYAEIDPKLVRYRELELLEIAMQMLRAIGTGADDAIYVAGDQAVHVLEPDGRLRRKITLDGAPRCLAVSGEMLFVGFEKHVGVFNFEGRQLAGWTPVEGNAVFTSIAADADNVFVADAGHRCVLRYDRSGKLLSELARRDPARNVPALVIPSFHCDVAIGSDGLLRVVNPGSHRIEFFTPAGDYEAPLAWGKRGPAVDEFSGCCNPVAIALLPDDRIVTAEKGLRRVKIYSADGDFQCVVATPEQLAPTDTAIKETRTDHKLLPVDVAADSKGRVLVLDPSAGGVHVYVKKEASETDE
jgi:hypothetical protein